MRDDVANIIDGIENEGGLLRGYIPGSDDPGYDDAWKSPAEAASQMCVSCHRADPLHAKRGVADHSRQLTRKEDCAYET